MQGIVKTFDIGDGRTVSIETGRLAKQADGAVVVKMGDTMLLATVVARKEAAENVKEGCNIFREYGDKQGQQMCEIFHNAVVRKNPDAWQEIIRNRKFSSNFYSLLCEYSDRKRADLESHKLSQI